MTRAEFLDAVAQYCMAMGASTTRWLSTRKHNKDVGGTPTSLHLIGMAIDIVYDDGLPPHDTAQEMAKKLGLYAFRKAGYTHDHLRPL
jgi:hypothetical protein